MKRLSCLACQLGWHPPGTVHLWQPKQLPWEPKWEGVMSVLRARGPLPPSTSGKLTPLGDDFSQLYPGIWEMLSAPMGPDGASRQGSTLMLFCQDGQCKGCLNDRDQDLVAFLSAGGVDSLLLAMEEGLQKDTIAWRAPKPYRKGKK